MHPPFVSHARLGFPLPDNTVPIPEWNQLGAFSTVRVCERARRRLLENLDAPVRQDLAKRDRTKVDDWFRGYLAAMHLSRCVPTEAAYPPKPTAPK